MKQPDEKEQMSSPWRQQGVFPPVFFVIGFPHKMAPFAAMCNTGDMRENKNRCSHVSRMLYLSTMLTYIYM